MAEEKRPADSQSPTREVLDKLGSDWGDDWESAFQAADSEDDEALLEEEFEFADESTDSHASPAAEADSGDGSAQAAAQDGPEISWLGFFKNFSIAGLLALLLSLPERFTALPTAARSLARKFAALSLANKIIVINCLLLLVLAVALLFRPGSDERLALVLPEDPFGIGSERAPGEPLFADDFHPLTGDQPPIPIIPEAAATAPGPERPTGPPSATEPHRLSLPGFMVPLDRQYVEGATAYVQVDLTLRLQLPPGQQPDPILAPVLRDSIYRFYQSKDRETLRRFSLARGEMLQELRLWLEQHHPELIIDTISFDRYWLN